MINFTFEHLHLLAIFWRHLGKAGCMQRLYNNCTKLPKKGYISGPLLTQEFVLLKKSISDIVATILAHLWIYKTDPVLSTWVSFKKSVTEGLTTFSVTSIFVWFFNCWILHWYILIFKKKTFNSGCSESKLSIKLETTFPFLLWDYQLPVRIFSEYKYLEFLLFVFMVHRGTLVSINIAMQSFPFCFFLLIKFVLLL